MMTRSARLPAAIVATAILASCATTGDSSRRILGTATLLTSDGHVAGNATLGTIGSGLDLIVEVQGMPAGLHGTHLHSTGRCEPRDFSSAGGHLNPSGMRHGSLNPDGNHLGDLPNLEIDENGNGTLKIELSDAADSALPEVFDADGTAIVIHSGPDDYRTDPSGSSGSRIACGVFARVR